MANFTLASFPSAVTKELLVVVYDLANFVTFSRENPSSQVFAALDEFYRISAEHIRNNRGHVVKFIGDAGLAIFAEEDADHGIRSMIQMKERLDHWLTKGIPGSYVAVNCHFGEVTIGPMHGPIGKYLDIIGDTVNICFTLGKRKFTISPQAFRKLNPESRQQFKKFTPPIVYNLNRGGSHEN